MRITFYGAARTVTGSQFLVEVNGSSVLIDCGMYQGRRSEMVARNTHFRFDPQAVDAVLLTHSHIDHSGNLPNLVKQGFRGPVYSTAASCDLTDLMLQDSGHIQESDAEYLNKKRARKGEPPVEPLYTQKDAAQVTSQMRPVDYNEWFEPVPGMRVRLRDAGHVLGSASIEMELEERGQKRRVWFSGDIGRRNMHLLNDPVLPEGKIDYLIMESTYGDKAHTDLQLAYEELFQVVSESIRERGKIIVPAFAVGRTQEIVYALNQFVSEKRMPAIPVYVDSPLAVNATDIFLRHPEVYDAETRKFIEQHRHPALEFPGLTYIRSVEESKALNNKPGPMIIISASGMAETGRILHHLKNNIEDPRNRVLIVSWQAPDTLGRRLAERAPKVRIFGDLYTRRAQVSTIGGLSGHAGQNLLTEYALAAASGGALRYIYLVHGEPDKASKLQSRLAGEDLNSVGMPEVGDSIAL